MCGWEGNESDLALIETDELNSISAIENDLKIFRRLPRPINVEYYKGCFQCETDDYLMDINEEND
jgi:hypothetical protein